MGTDALSAGRSSTFNRNITPARKAASDYYTPAGNVAEAVTNVGDTQLFYARNRQTVVFERDFIPNSPSVSTSVREFRYDGARQRYLVRELDPDTEFSGPLKTLSQTWSDYDGDSIYGDYDVVQDRAASFPNPPPPPQVSELRSYEPGLGMIGWMTGSANVPDPTTVQYVHTDLIGTTRMLSDSGGTGVSPVVYTAFGEQVGGSAQRFGYAGAFGYQTDTTTDPALRFPFLHVGARYYDPATGRFLQRDSIGIRGGLNVYAYVRGTPTITIDPSGLIGAGGGGDAFYFTGGGTDPAFSAGKHLGDHLSPGVRNAIVGVPIGVGFASTAPAAAVYAALCYAGFRVFGGSTGDPAIDGFFDGVGLGVGAGTLPGLGG